MLTAPSKSKRLSMIGCSLIVNKDLLLKKILNLNLLTV